ncbi:MAG: hypothetical protein ABIZ81_08600 [Opitutaceae bacterium]
MRRRTGRQQYRQPRQRLLQLVIGIVFSGLVGVTAGLYPAIRASRLSPVEALRSD